MMTKFYLTTMVCGTVAILAARGDSDEGMSTSLSLGLTVTDGNSETILGNVALLTEGEKNRLGSLRAGMEANYGENTVRREVTEDGETTRAKETTTSVENARIFANARKTITDRTFAYVDGSALYDDIAEIDYRAIVGPGMGTYLVKGDRLRISVELGAAYIWEDVADERDDYMAVRFAERIEYAISETARLWQSAEFLPKADDFDDYLINSEVGIEAAMNARLNLRVVLQDKYDSHPGAGLKKNDLTLIAGIRAML